MRNQKQSDVEAGGKFCNTNMGTVVEDQKNPDGCERAPEGLEASWPVIGLCNGM